MITRGMYINSYRSSDEAMNALDGKDVVVIQRRDLINLMQLCMPTLIQRMHKAHQSSLYYVLMDIAYIIKLPVRLHTCDTYRKRPVPAEDQNEWPITTQRPYFIRIFNLIYFPSLITGPVRSASTKAQVRVRASRRRFRLIPLFL